MKINETADIPAPVDQVWTLLDDIPSVATCMPGAELTRAIDDSTYEGLVKVSVGPLAMHYTGTITINERDEQSHTISMFASGRDRRGSGTAKANVTVQLTPNNNATQLTISGDLQLTGRVASVGRGVQDVSSKLFAEFGEQLAMQLQHGETSPAGTLVSGDPATVASQSTPSSQTSTTKDRAAPSAAAAEVASQSASGNSGSVKVGWLIWSITREKLAAFLVRLSQKVSP